MSHEHSNESYPRGSEYIRAYHKIGFGVGMVCQNKKLQRDFSKKMDSLDFQDSYPMVVKTFCQTLYNPVAYMPPFIT